MTMSIKTTSEDGTVMYRLNGKLHRDDGPAVEHPNGTKEWYIDGKRHRVDGRPAIEFANGTNFWFRNGKSHREDGPAIEYVDGTKEWYRNGELHRIDGPAVEYEEEEEDGVEWFLNGEEYTFQQYIQKLESDKITSEDVIKRLQAQYFLENA